MMTFRKTILFAGVALLALTQSALGLTRPRQPRYTAEVDYISVQDVGANGTQRDVTYPQFHSDSVSHADAINARIRDYVLSDNWSCRDGQFATGTYKNSTQVTLVSQNLLSFQNYFEIECDGQKNAFTQSHTIDTRTREFLQLNAQFAAPKAAERYLRDKLLSRAQVEKAREGCELAFKSLTIGGFYLYPGNTLVVHSDFRFKDAHCNTEVEVHRVEINDWLRSDSALSLGF